MVVFSDGPGFEQAVVASCLTTAAKKQAIFFLQISSSTQSLPTC